MNRHKKMRTKRQAVSVAKREKKKFIPNIATKRGVIQSSGRGYAFFVSDDGSPDLFIAPRDLGGAIHGDKVLVAKISQDRGAGEGKVVEILERTFEHIVGRVEDGCLIPSEKGFGNKIYIERRSSQPFFPGDKVVAKLCDGGDYCIVTEVLGEAGDLGAEIMGVIRSFKLAETFPSKVKREAEEIPDSVSEEEKKGRRNFTDTLAVTIDGEHSKDFDDAICVRKVRGGYELSVHIADVSHYVREKSKLDKEALKRATSVYFADRVLPMLPEKLSNGICSLNEGVERLTLSVVMRFDKEGELLSHEIVEGVIKSKARLSYSGVQRMLDGEKSEKHEFLREMIQNASALAKILNKKRIARGSVEFEIPECEIIMDGDKLIDIKKAERLFSHRMIEEFMLITNETVAEHFVKRKVPFVFRVHENPPEQKLEVFRDFLCSLGLSFPENPTPMDYAQLVANADESVRGAVSRVALRSMSKAEYKPQNLGHFGLASKYYCHFTSPIRRYPDLAIHRIIKYILSGKEDASRQFSEFVREASIRSSERERTAEEAERKVDDFLKAEFMKDKIGNEYRALISGVTERGLYAELDFGVEGMIKIETIPGRFKFNEKSMSISNGAISYTLGDEIDIKVVAVNFDKIAFELI